MKGRQTWSVSRVLGFCSFSVSRLIDLFLFICIKNKFFCSIFQTHSSFSTLHISHAPHFPRSSFSTLLFFHAPPHFQRSTFFTLSVFHASHFSHSSFPTLHIFHTPYFPHSSSSTLPYSSVFTILRTPYSGTPNQSFELLVIKYQSVMAWHLWQKKTAMKSLAICFVQSQVQSRFLLVQVPARPRSSPNLSIRAGGKSCRTAY